MKSASPVLALAAMSLIAAGLVPSVSDGAPLGLPEVAVPADNPQTLEKIALGERLFKDMRFSATGTVSCASCHATDKAFTDGPLSVSLGINGLTGTRNAPTVVNAAYSKTMFWDGRSPSLEDQAKHPFLNPVEMGLKDHEPILKVIRGDGAYSKAFAKVYGVKSKDITIDHVTRSIAAFERTIVSGSSPFDLWFFGGDDAALSEHEKRGYQLFINEARCVSCHVIEQDQAIFTDNRFHNIGVGINRIQSEIPKLASEFIDAHNTQRQVDEKVLSDARVSELGRFAVTSEFDGIGAFKTPTLRNVAATAPYMHDGSIKTLRLVLEHYNNGGVSTPGEPVNDFLSGGMRPLNLSERQLDDLEAFVRALTSPEYAPVAAKSHAQ